MNFRASASIVLPAVTAGMISGLLALLSSMQVIGQRPLFIAMTLLLLAYLALELRRLSRVHPQRWLLNPVAMASFLTFALSFGVTNVLFFLPPETIGAVGLVQDVTPSMVKLMWLVLAGAIAMWMGYWSPIAARLSGPKAQRKSSRWIRGATKPRLIFIGLLYAAAILARLVQVRLGIFGYSSNYERLIAYGGITQYLGMIASLGLLSLLLMALTHYWNPSSVKYKYVFIAILFIDNNF